MSLCLGISEPIGKDSAAYKILSGSIEPVLDIPTMIKDNSSVSFAPRDSLHLVDLRNAAPLRNVSSNSATFTGFGRPHDAKEWVTIDFIFGNSRGSW
jgi:hypothetical protein